MTRAWIAGAVLLLLAAPAAAQLGVFQGDPLDPIKNAPYVLLPGLPLVYPGADGVYGTLDDVVDTQLTGDVDLVVRTQGIVAAGVIPPPASGIGTAPLVVAGGEHGSAGTRLPFQVIVSDGVTPPATGSALAAPELDMHGALVIAYPDLDGDGVIGPTGAPGAAVEVQRQETLQIAGRRPAILVSGTAADSIGVSLGAPASAGGLGLVLAAVGTTGATPGLYLDGPWIATALPYMLPLDPSTYFDSDGEPSADGVVEIELAREDIRMPAPDDPILGAAYALPLDGSSPTIDLARSVSGPVVGAMFGRPVDPATFVADFARRLLPVVDALGARSLVESVDALEVPTTDAGGAATLIVFVADLLGNATDPAPGGSPVVVEVGSSLRIVAPDVDGNPQRETLPFMSAAFATIEIADVRPAGGGSATDRIVARLAAMPVASVRVTLAGGPPAPTATTSSSTPSAGVGTPSPSVSATPTPPVGPVPVPLVTARARMTRAKRLLRDRIVFTATFLGDTSAIAPLTQTISLVLRNAAGVVYERTIGAGSFAANKARTSFSFRDGNTSITIKRARRTPSKHTIRIVGSHLDLGGADFTAPNLTASVGVGGITYEAALACRVARNRRSAECFN